MKMRIGKTFAALTVVLSLALCVFGCADYKSVTDMQLNQSQVTLALGETFQIVPTFEPEDATILEATYESGAPEVATVDANGLVTAVGVGNTTIHVTSKSNKIAL